MVKKPDSGSLQNAALAHLARFAATELGLTRVLLRRIDRWARSEQGEAEAVAEEAARLRAVAKEVSARLAASGVVDDKAFATGRSRSLAHAGRSRRAIAAHLAAKGVAKNLTAEAVPADPEHELAAALIHARKRRLGPFRKAEPVPETRRRELASLARAGFSGAVANQALATTRREAEAAINKFRARL